MGLTSALQARCAVPKAVCCAEGAALEPDGHRSEGAGEEKQGALKSSAIVLRDFYVRLEHPG